MLTVEKVLNDRTIDRIADEIVLMQSRENTTIHALEQERKECEKSISNLLNAIQAGILTPSTKDRLEQLEAQRDKLDEAILQAKMERPVYTKEEIVRWIKHYKHGNINDKDYQKEIIDTFLNSIYLYDDYLVLTYNYKDGTETLTLEEIEAAFRSELNSLAPPKQPFLWDGCFSLSCPLKNRTFVPSETIARPL